jgi:hypothetical protein
MHVETLHVVELFLTVVWPFAAPWVAEDVRDWRRRRREVSGELERRPDPRSGLDEHGEWSPAFEGQRPPFEPGNELGRRFEPGHELSTRHGAYSQLKLGPRVDELVELIRPDVPMLRPADELTVRLLAVTLARLERALGALEEAEPGSMEKLESDARGWVNRAAQLADKLGLNPTSRARLGVDVATARRTVTLTELAEEAEEERRRAGAEGGAG